MTAVSIKDPTKTQSVVFSRATADYSQPEYPVANTIDGTVSGNNGWAVDGPTRKKPAKAMFVAKTPFGFEGGTELVFRLRHEAGFPTHGVGRPRLSITRDNPASLDSNGVPSAIRRVAATGSTERTAKESDQLEAYVIRQRAVQENSIKARIAELSRSSAEKYPATMIMRDMPKPRDTHFLELGQYDRKRQVVQPGVPASLTPLGENAPKNRLGFARWLVDPKHPLTARVAVNRYWRRLFGVGLVKTSEDFGTQGEWPSHPELLDSLAIRFAKDWDVKAIQRLMLTSAAYRQDSRVSKQLHEKDPENRLLGRGPRFRLDAEQIRDQALAASGLLVEKVGGPSVYPYQPPGLWMELNNRPGYSKAYQQGKGDDLYRRSVYTFWKRTAPSPMLKTFDAPDREFCTASRSRTNTPLQALLLLQGPQFVEAARRLARRMLVEGGESVASRINFGFERVVARKPSPDESAILARVLQDRRRFFTEHPEAAAKMLSVGESPRDGDLELAEHAAWM
ncbi:MAG: DUF1553 domain-containing protein, partial [Planctomycetales bacterium]